MESVRLKHLSNLALLLLVREALRVSFSQTGFVLSGTATLMPHKGAVRRKACLDAVVSNNRMSAVAAHIEAAVVAVVKAGVDADRLRIERASITAAFAE